MASEPSDAAVIALGRKLVEHLEFEPDNDLLAGWMAHYLAERMLAVETATPETRDALARQCAEAVLEVWAHRHELEPAIPAFDDLRALEGAILALEPDRTPFRYASPLQGAMSASRPSKEGRQWIELAAIIDDSARELIRYCLRRALDESIETGEAWLDTAREALGEDGPERTIITFLRSGEDRAVEGLKSRVDWLQSRVRKLDALVALSGALSGELSEQLRGAQEELSRAEVGLKPKPKAEGAKT
ncbi:hypothetical protein [uncultured Brevundimonas sp.]|uniref:hypothetical protein n=1 Tax=uncultured Brevundimonas sp. TaxID=213418 RepID=UPI0025DE39D4|nr:hypothetical protein [uncultured Brevundimonas sp.]